ncbi:MAG: type-4 uracil-DNA glycosylase [Patescibacteria group bacterium]|nr:MAG: type-4 uracil-DNA glycosylase [Patescibacteria group bacterium]
MSTEKKQKNKQGKLAEIDARWIRQCSCTLREEATQAVPGDGSAEAEIMFIGEAPGKKEDIEGKPFVGAAGKFLGEMLREIGLAREDVYITNVVKYRPPGNRDPLPEEVEACRGWLEEQVALIDPKLIVLLGRHALLRFFPEEKISQMHGKVLKRTTAGLGRRNFFALYHPAAALYNGSMREVLLEDFKKIPKVLELVKKPHSS